MDSAYSPGHSAAATSDDSGLVIASCLIHESCMRAQSDHSGRLICMCHLDGEYSSDTAAICYEPTGLVTSVDIENEFPPLSSSPPEVASSSPHSVSASSDEEGSVETFISSSSLDIPSLPDRRLARNSDDFPRHTTYLELTLVENDSEHLKSGTIDTPSKSCWSTKSSPSGSVLRTAHDSRGLNRSGSCPRIYSRSGSHDESRSFLTGFQDPSYTTTGQHDADGEASVFEGRKKMTKLMHVLKMKAYRLLRAMSWKCHQSRSVQILKIKGCECDDTALFSSLGL